MSYMQILPNILPISVCVRAGCGLTDLRMWRTLSKEVHITEEITIIGIVLVLQHMLWHCCKGRPSENLTLEEHRVNVDVKDGTNSVTMDKCARRHCVVACL